MTESQSSAETPTNDQTATDNDAAGAPSWDLPEDAPTEESGSDEAPDKSEPKKEPTLEEQLTEWKDLALRARADLDNYRKRMATEKSQAIRYANQSLFESLLPVLDNFHFGLDAARNATDPSGILMGMEMVQKQFEDFLSQNQVTAIEASAGTAFDPNIHDAVAQEHDNEVEEGAIIKVIRAGYRMGDRLVRAANVVVSKGPESSQAAED